MAQTASKILTDLVNVGSSSLRQLECLRSFREIKTDGSPGSKLALGRQISPGRKGGERKQFISEIQGYVLYTLSNCPFIPASSQGRKTLELEGIHRSPRRGPAYI